MPGLKIVHFTEVPSTNLMALEMGRKGAAHGTVVHAESQSKGRGRMEKPFASPPGGLYISIILRPELEPEFLPLVTLAAGVACCKTVEAETGLAVQLKWPNDLYVGNKKLAGILTESSPYSLAENTIPFVVVGIGLNVNTTVEMFPLSLQESVTSLYCLQNRCYEPGQFIPAIVKALDLFIAQISTDRRALFDYWKKRDYLFGKKICWLDPSRNRVYGSGDGLHEDGTYTLRTSEGKIYSIIGGEIQLLDEK